MEYSKNIIGRKHEQDILNACVETHRAEFIAIYGRRRIGKTFLVKQFFQDSFDFYTTGIYKISKAEQLKDWQEKLRRYSGVKRTRPKDWFEAFYQLQDFLETKAEQEKIIIFIDELPWLDTPKSNFLRALEMFWNSWASTRNGLKLIVCGSATTWMTNKLLGDKGGLHNRVTSYVVTKPLGKKKKGCFISYQICLRCSTSDLSRTTMAWMSMHGAICLKGNAMHGLVMRLNKSVFYTSTKSNMLWVSVA